MPTAQELYDFYRAQEAQYGNPSDPNAYAAQFLQNAIGAGIDGGTLTQLAQMVNPSFYAQQSDYAPAAASGNFDTPQWQNLNQFSDTARAQADAADGMIGNNVPTQGGMMNATGTGAGATVTPQTGPASGWQYAAGTPAPQVPSSVRSLMDRQLGSRDTFDPAAMLRSTNRGAMQMPQGSAPMSMRALNAQAPGQFNMPQAPQMPGQPQTNALNLQAPAAPQLPGPMNAGPLQFQQPNAPQAQQANLGALNIERPNGPQQLGDLNAPGLPGAVSAPSTMLNRPQGPASINDPALAGYTRNPAIDGMLDSLGQRIGQFRDEGLQGVRSNAIAVGGMGGSRQGIAEQGVIKDANDAYSNAAAQLLYSDYNDASNRNLQKYGQDASFALGKGQLGQSKYATDASLAATEGQLGQQAFGTQVQQNLGLGGLANDRFDTQASYALGRGGLDQQRYGAELGFAGTMGGLQNQRAGLDLQNAQNQNSYNASIYGTQMQGALGQAGLQNDRLGLQNSYDLGRANAANQQYGTQANFALGAAGLQNQQNQQNQQYALGLGNLAQQQYGTQMTGALGQATLGNSRYLGELGYNSNLANTQVAADRARNDFYTAQRGQDYQGLLTGAQLQAAEQAYEWAPVLNASQIYAGFSGLGSQIDSGTGGGWAGALGGALSGAALGGRLGLWGEPTKQQSSTSSPWGF